MLMRIIIIITHQIRIVPQYQKTLLRVRLIKDLYLIQTNKAYHCSFYKFKILLETMLLPIITQQTNKFLKITNRNPLIHKKIPNKLQNTKLGKQKRIQKVERNKIKENNKIITTKANNKLTNKFADINLLENTNYFIVRKLTKSNENSKCPNNILLKLTQFIQKIIKNISFSKISQLVKIQQIKQQKSQFKKLPNDNIFIKNILCQNVFQLMFINHFYIIQSIFHFFYFIINFQIASMLQFAAVLTTGGLLLFSTVMKIDQTIILSLVNRIIDMKNLQAQFVIQTFKIQYLYDAILGLVYVIAWRKEIDLQYPEKLLKAMSIQWKDIYQRIIKKDDLILDAPNFDEPWDRAFNNWKTYLNQRQQQGRKMKTFNQKNRKKSTIKQQKIQQSKKDQNQQKSPSQTNQSPRTSSIEDDWQSLSPKQRFLRKQQQKSKIKSPKKSEIIQSKSQVKPRQSFDYKMDKKTIQSLDRSKSQIRDRSKSPKMEQKYMEQMTKQQKITGFLDSDQQSDQQGKQNTFFSKWVGKIKNVVGDKQITKEDLSEVLVEFKQKLMEKNVAQDVAIKISDAVGATLLEQKTKSFTSVSKTVKEAMKEALKKILTPKRKIDLVVQVTKQREKLKPYVIVFVGVNGVGKSTNLAKVAYKLKNAKLSVMLAACDNFRAGAVQQIQTHGRNLDIPVFSKGYKEQPANIAYQAIKDATKKRIDAVLVDTAGRMQDNQPLMKQLASLVKLNKPNLVVFIGQALVGNGAVDQITKFNKALQDQSTPEFTPQIDAILLSKFDTVDDKVGTALSLVYSTSKPILFVGVGQKYPNLKELNVSTVVHALLS